MIAAGVVMSVFFAALVVQLFVAFVMQIHYNPYSYNTIFYFGFGLFLLSVTIEVIVAAVQSFQYPDLYQEYQLKERLRIILHLKDPYLAEEELRKWINDARNSGLKYFIPLADKIERHIANIMRSIECHANSAKSEATNTTIKALIKTARGFRNLDNMFALIMLRCSDIVIPLNNRYRPDAELQVRKRELANQRKADRENAKREAHGFKYSPTQGT